jgi:hypothetical protein
MTAKTLPILEAQIEAHDNYTKAQTALCSFCELVDEAGPQEDDAFIITLLSDRMVIAYNAWKETLKA